MKKIFLLSMMFGSALFASESCVNNNNVAAEEQNEVEVDINAQCLQKLRALDEFQMQNCYVGSEIQKLKDGIIECINKEIDLEYMDDEGYVIYDLMFKLKDPDIMEALQKKLYDGRIFSRLEALCSNLYNEGKGAFRVKNEHDLIEMMDVDCKSHLLYENNGHFLYQHIIYTFSPRIIEEAVKHGYYIPRYSTYVDEIESSYMVDYTSCDNFMSDFIKFALFVVREHNLYGVTPYDVLSTFNTIIKNMDICEIVKYYISYAVRKRLSDTGMSCNLKELPYSLCGDDKRQMTAECCFQIMVNELEYIKKLYESGNYEIGYWSRVDNEKLEYVKIIKNISTNNMYGLDTTKLEEEFWKRVYKNGINLFYYESGKPLIHYIVESGSISLVTKFFEFVKDQLNVRNHYNSYEFFGIKELLRMKNRYVPLQKGTCVEDNIFSTIMSAALTHPSSDWSAIFDKIVDILEENENKDEYNIVDYMLDESTNLDVNYDSVFCIASSVRNDNRYSKASHELYEKIWQRHSEYANNDNFFDFRKRRGNKEEINLQAKALVLYPVSGTMYRIKYEN